MILPTFRGPGIPLALKVRDICKQILQTNTLAEAFSVEAVVMRTAGFRQAMHRPILAAE